jgi:hypothetical protein
MFAHGDADESYLAYKQKRREVLCALTLAGLLRQFEHGDEGEFEADMHREAQALVQAPVGVALVWTCGYIYEHKGQQALGGLEAVGARASETVHSFANNYRIASAAIKTYRAFRKDISDDGKSKKKKAEKEKAEKEKEKAGSSDADGSADGSGANGDKAPKELSVGDRATSAAHTGRGPCSLARLAPAAHRPRTGLTQAAQAAHRPRTAFTQLAHCRCASMVLVRAVHSPRPRGAPRAQRLRRAHQRVERTEGALRA